MRMPKRVPLVNAVTFITAGVVAASMAGYACIQYVFDGRHSISNLMLEHGWHVIVLGLISFGVLNWVLVKQVVDPICKLHFKLYSLTRGDLTPINIPSRISEIQDMAEGINAMLVRFDDISTDVRIADLSATAETIRNVAKRPDTLTGEGRGALLNAARKVDEIVAALTKRILHEQMLAAVVSATRKLESDCHRRQAEQVAHPNENRNGDF